MEKIFYASMATPLLNEIYIASTEKGVFMIDFHTTEKGFVQLLKRHFPGEIVKDEEKNRGALSQLKKYLAGELKEFDCPLDLRGTPFRQKVWAELLKIPYGQTRSYQEIAKAMGRPKACRAVGSANGANPVPIIVPCHRVIESSGGLGGYGQGIEIKKRLLQFEKAHGI